MAEHGTVKDLLFTLADEVVNQNADYDIILIIKYMFHNQQVVLA